MQSSRPVPSAISISSDPSASNLVVSDKDTNPPEGGDSQPKTKFWQLFFRITSSGNYIRELDGLRFLAIAAVLTAHTWGNWGNYTVMKYDLASPTTVEQLHLDLTLNGILGVQLFFIISGFILSLPWARHFLKGGTAIPLRKYYVRRLTRLEPPYIIAMVVYFILLCRV